VYADQTDFGTYTWNKMIEVRDAYEAMVSSGIDMFTGVPDSLLKNICAYITDTAPREKHIIAANEGNAVGIAAGHYLATGKPALVYMQNSGLGNTVNPLLSLADEKVYSIPMVLLIGWRGEPGVHDEPQHVKQGEVTLGLLDTMQIPYIILEDASQIGPQVKLAMVRKSPVALVVRKGTFGSYKLKNASTNDNPLSREEALKLVIDHLHQDDVIVSTTGKLSRELFEYREAQKQGHGHDFLTVGSMGHSSSIALGIALEKPERRVFCFDGDGAFIMHTGSLGIVASMKPRNFYHILFNNGAHESVGGQPTIGYQLDAVGIAKASGYQQAIQAVTKQEMVDALQKLETIEGPVLLELRVKIESREDLGRPTTTPIENKQAFMKELGIVE
jgi:phosphonopyruvate decarboxylase